jgi:hypothetical protein
MQVAHGVSATPTRVRRPLVCVRPRLGGQRARRGGLPRAAGCRTLAWRAERQGVAAEQDTRCRGKARVRSRKILLFILVRFYDCDSCEMYKFVSYVMYCCEMHRDCD